MINPLILLLQGISGGIAGYITNKYAVNMLFKEYTPLKLGGVVKKNKEKFIDEISTLVEKDIINGTTLKEQIHSEKFKLQIEKTVEKFFYKGLNQSFEDLSINQLIDYQGSKEGILKFSEESINAVIKDLVNNFLGNIEFNRIFSPKQVDKVVEILYEEIVEYIKENKNLNILINDLYYENRNIKVNEIISSEIREDIKNKIVNCLSLYLEEAFKDNDKLLEVLNKIYEVIDLDKIIYELFKNMENNKITDYIDEEEINNISKGINNNLKQLINSEKGRENIENILKEIIKICHGLDFTLYEILPEESGENLSAFIEEVIEKVLPYISEWIKFNREEVNNLIEESIDESIGSIDGSIKRIIIQKVRASLLNNISEKANVVDRIVKYIEEYNVDGSSSKRVSQFIINYLKDNKVKDIVVKLENSNILSNSNIIALSNIIINKFHVYGENIINLILSGLLNKSIGELIGDEKVYKLSQFIKEKINDNVIINKKHILNYMKINIEKIVINKGDEIFNYSLKELVSNDKLVYDFENNLTNLLESNKVTIKNTLTKIANDKISKIETKELLLENGEMINEILLKFILSCQEEVINKYENYSIGTLLDKVVYNEELVQYSKNQIYKYICDNIEEILHGNVKKVIYDNLIRFNEDEICDLAQSFMGNELKPLSIFGGILGIIVGLIYGVFSSNVNIAGFYNGFIPTITSCIMMALIGVMTNVIALKMLFYPYKRNKFLAKIPFLRKFSLGYIPAHKGDLATAIGDVIENELLNGKKIKTILNEKTDTFKGYLISKISESNYKIIVDKIKTREENISKLIYEKIKENIENNKEKISNKAALACGNMSINKAIKKDSLYKLVNIIKEKNIFIEEKILIYLEKKLNSEKKVCELLPKELMDKINISINDGVETFINNKAEDFLCEKNIRTLAMNNEEKYSEFIDKTFIEIIGEEYISDILSKGSDFIIELVFKDSKDKVAKAIEDFLSDEIHGEKSIGNIFNGNVAKYVNSNLPRLSGYFIDKVSEYLKNNRETFSIQIRKEIVSSLNFLEKGAYMMFGGDAIVDRCVDTMINIKVPVFLNNKYLEINSVLQNCLYKSIYPINITALKLKAQEIDINLILNSVYESLNDSDFAKEQIREMYSYTINLVSNVKIKNITEVVNLHTLEGIFNKFNNEINFVLNESKFNLRENNEVLNKYSMELINDIFIHKFKESKASIINEIIDPKGIKEILHAIFDKIIGSKTFNSNLLYILDEFYNENLNNKQVKNYIDIEELKEFIIWYIDHVINDDEFNNTNIKIINEIIIDAVVSEFNFIKDDTKDHIAYNVIDGIINVIIEDTVNILKAVSLKKITMEQIAVMEPKEIHDLFNSFAGEFFKKLYLYGSFGAVFGINLWLSILWGVIEEVNNIREK